jgi:hypothetical protein
LNIPIWSDPALAPQAEAIARKIAGPNAEAETLELARRIGEDKLISTGCAPAARRC